MNCGPQFPPPVNPLMWPPSFDEPSSTSPFVLSQPQPETAFTPPPSNDNLLPQRSLPQPLPLQVNDKVLVLTRNGRSAPPYVDGGSDQAGAKPQKAGWRRNSTPRLSMTQSKLRRILRGANNARPPARMNGNDPKPKRNQQHLGSHRNKSSNRAGKNKPTPHRRQELLKPPKTNQNS